MATDAQGRGRAVDVLGHPCDGSAHAQVGGEDPVVTGVEVGDPSAEHVGHEREHRDAHDAAVHELGVGPQPHVLEAVLADAALDADACRERQRRIDHDLARLPAAVAGPFRRSIEGRARSTAG
jgi:hypothetical protein